jgi:quercetin dioxygenase-like cupin family protein
MVHVGQELTGSGNILRFIRTAAETDGELLEMESTYREGAQLPAAHFHPSQDEYFEVLEGTVTTIIDGVEASHAAGETFHVPAGAVHQMVGEAGTRLNWQVRPALRTAEFFEGLYTGSAAARRGEEFDLAAFLAGHTDEIQFPDD